MATNDQICSTCIPDDNDDFYIDNLWLVFPCECDDIECSSVNILWPYTMTPASQATQIPVTVRACVTTGTAAGSFLINVRIFPGKSSTVIPAWRNWFNYQNTDSTLEYPQPKAVYCQRLTVPMIYPDIEKQVSMPAWNARLSGHRRLYFISISNSARYVFGAG